MAELTTNKSKAEVLEALRRLPGALAGDGGAAGAVGRFYDGLADTILKVTQHAFDAKAAGGVDENGDSWPPVKPESIARRKTFGGDQVKDRRRSRGKVSKKGVRASLDDAQDKRWALLYQKSYARLKKTGHKHQEAAQKAAAHAWFILKNEGARTLREMAQEEGVEWLKDTEALYDSYRPLSEGHSPDRVVEIGRGTLKVKSGLPYADAHVNGVPETGLPARPPVEQDIGRWKGQYKEMFEESIAGGIVLVLEELLG